MKTLQLFDVIRIMIPTAFGNVSVEFTVIAILYDDEYILIAQDRVVKCRVGGERLISLSKPIDMMNEITLSPTYVMEAPE